MHLVISKNLWLSTKQPDPCRILALQNWSVHTHTHTHRLRIYSAVPVLHGFSLSEVNILSYLMFLKHPDIYFWQTLSAESSMSCQSPIILDSEFLGDDLMLFPCLYDCRNHLAPNQADSVSTSARPVSVLQYWYWAYWADTSTGQCSSSAPRDDLLLSNSVCWPVSHDPAITTSNLSIV